ncbi:ABC transporter substrate-binding protein [Orrella sp. JC864]|uniref:ABC transporter substrate-binding protein n=1 Tax=Orrella sp. JC864 TaxID=3120298 RepID=UPI003009ACA1
MTRRLTPISSSRRQLVLGATAAAALGGLAPAFVRAQQDAYRIGHLTPRTGFLGPMGEYAVLGATLAVEEVNAAGGVLGRPLQLMSEDSVNPHTASTKAHRMVERDKVLALVGEISSASGLAISQVAQRANKLFLQTGCNSDELRGANCARTMFHLEANNTMYVRTVGQALLRDGMVKGKRWMAFTADYAFGHDLFAKTRQFMDEHGGQFLSNDMVPTDTTEFSALILKIRQQRPDIVISNLAGNQTTNFMKQYNEFGLPIPLAGADLNAVSIWGAGRDGFSGLWPIIWTHQVQAPSARQFTQAFTKRFGRPPDNQGVADYLAIKILARAMNETRSDDTDKLVEYLESGVTFDVLREREGHFRPWDHQLLFEMYTVTPNEDKSADKWDIFQTSSPVPGKDESLEALAPTMQENACKFA